MSLKDIDIPLLKETLQFHLDLKPGGVTRRCPICECFERCEDCHVSKECDDYISFVPRDHRITVESQNFIIDLLKKIINEKESLEDDKKNGIDSKR